MLKKKNLSLELRKKLESYKKSMERIEKYSLNLLNRLSTGKINREEYDSLRNKKIDEKTIDEWAIQIDEHISSLEKKIDSLQRKKRESNQLKILGALFLFFGFLGIMTIYIFSNEPVLFSPQMGVLVEQIDLEFNSSGGFNWSPNNSKDVRGVKISGSVIGEGTVNIYVEKKLVANLSGLGNSSKTFSDVCMESCNITFPGNNTFLFKIEIVGNLSVFLDSLTYNVINNAPLVETNNKNNPIRARTIGSDFRIQRGNLIIPSGSLTGSIKEGIDFVACSGPCFIKQTSTRNSGMGRTSGGGYQNFDDFETYVSDDSGLQLPGGNIVFERNGLVNDDRITWEIWEYQGPLGKDNEMKVLDTGVCTFSSSSMTCDGVPIIEGAGNNSDVVVFITGRGNPDVGRNGLQMCLVTSEWVASTNLPRFTRRASGNNCDVSYSVVEFSGLNWRVQRIEHIFNTSTIQRETISSVGNISKAFFHTQQRNNVGANFDGLCQAGSEVELTTPTTINYNLSQSITGWGPDMTAVTWVIWNTQVGGQEIVVNHYNPLEHPPGFSKEDNWQASVSGLTYPLDEIAITGLSSQSAGCGVAFPRGSINAYLTSLNSIDFWQSDSGQAQEYTFQVVEFPTAPLTNSPASSPTEIKCNGGLNCDILADSNLQLESIGSVDAESDMVTYFLEANLFSSINSGDLESGVVQTTASSGADVLGETGEVLLSDLSTLTVNFANSYSVPPVVLATPVTENSLDNNYPIPIISGITTSGFNISVCVDAGLVGCNSPLSPEKFHYFVFDPQKSNAYNWIDVGTTSVTTDGVDTILNYGKTFSNVPTIWTTPQTYNQGGNIAAVVWVEDSLTKSTSSSPLVGCVHQAPGSGGSVNTCTAGQPNEVVGYVAIDELNSNINSFQSGSASIGSSSWTVATFNPTYVLPRVMVTQNDDNGIQDPQYPWARNVLGNGMDYRYCEQDAAGVCDAHAGEMVDWFSLEQGNIEINTGVLDSEANKSWKVYNNTLGNDAGVINELKINVSVSIFNNSGSVTIGNLMPDLELSMWNGTGFVSVGTFSVTGPGIFTLSVSDPTILNSWVAGTNTNLRIRGINFDYTALNSDEISYDGVFVDKISKSWTEIGNHLDGTPFNWNTALLPTQTDVNLRAKAIDLSGSNVYSNYFTKNPTPPFIEINHGISLPVIIDTNLNYSKYWIKNNDSLYIEITSCQNGASYNWTVDGILASSTNPFIMDGSLYSYGVHNVTGYCNNVFGFDSVSFDIEVIDKDDWTLIVLPDTQEYTVMDNGIYENQTEWIVELEKGLDIKFMVHVGDLVGHSFTPTLYENRWITANRSQSIMDGKVPYGVTVGNHDYDDFLQSSRNTSYFNKYFNYTRFQNFYPGNFGGNFGGSGDATYFFFNASGREYIVIFAPFCPTDEQMNWVNTTLHNYPNKQAIFVTHAYLRQGDIRFFDEDNALNNADAGGCIPPKHPFANSTLTTSNDGRQIWEKYLQYQNNLFLTLNGHFNKGEIGNNTANLTSNGFYGNQIHQLFMNYQNPIIPNGGDGFLRIMRFSPRENKIIVSTYSPYLDQYIEEWNPLYANTGHRLNISYNFGVGNSAPEVTYVSSIGGVYPLSGNVKKIQFNVTVFDVDGNINPNSVFANFTHVGEPVRGNVQCNNLFEDGPNTKNFSCTIEMQYFDAPGDWNINVIAKDSSGASGINNTTNFTYYSIKSMVIDSTSIDFVINAGGFNKTALNGGVIINNTGNSENSLAVEGLNLIGPTNILGVSNFSSDIITGVLNPECAGPRLVNGTNTIITNLIRGNLSAGGGQTTLYFCLTNVPASLPAQTYSTGQGSWMIRILIVGVSVKRRKKKKIKKDRLLEAIGILSEEFSDKHSIGTKKAIKLIIEEVSDKQKTSIKKTKKSEDLSGEIFFPTSVFTNKAGILETISKYLRENKKLSYQKISTLLKRDSRTIWTSYNKSKLKLKNKLEVKPWAKLIPLSKIVRKNSTLLEGLVVYLRLDKMTFSEIGALLCRDQRNIRAIYIRALRKSSLKSV